MSEQVKLEDVDLETMKKDTEKLSQSNEAKAKSLGAPVNPAIIAAIKVEVFVETFLDENAKTVFNYNFHLRMRKEFDEALAQVRQAQLMQGVPNTGKLHIAR